MSEKKEDTNSQDHDHNHGTEVQNHHEHSGGFVGKIKSIFFHSHSHEEDHTLTDEDLETEKGIRAVKISFLGLMVTAVLQIFFVAYTRSVSLYADTIHNFSDAFTSIPLWISYRLGKKGKTKDYTYGYGKVEDLAGLFIVIMILFSALLVFWESFMRLLNPEEIRHVEVLAIAAVIGFVGNELVARYRVRIGKEIGSEALIADGLHSRTDGYVSLSVLFGAFGASIGYPIIDTIVGLIIGIMILFLVKGTMENISKRLLDGVDPKIVEDISMIAKQVDGVQDIHDVRARWCGRKMVSELHIVVNRDLTVAETHEITDNLEITLTSKINRLAQIVVHPDPCDHHVKTIH